MYTIQYFVEDSLKGQFILHPKCVTLFLATWAMRKNLCQVMFSTHQQRKTGKKNVRELDDWSEI